MKLAFLLSVAIGIAMVVAAGVLWTVLDGMGVFTEINDFLSQILGRRASSTSTTTSASARCSRSAP